jgi:hypothetical protein
MDAGFLAILACYRVLATAAATDTTVAERDEAAAGALARMGEGCRTLTGRTGCKRLESEARDPRLRKGRRRFRRREPAVPDIANLSRRKASTAASGRTPSPARADARLPSRAPCLRIRRPRRHTPVFRAIGSPHRNTTSWRWRDPSSVP